VIINKKKAFTLFEIIMVAAIIWILTLWMTTYMWGGWEKAKIIEAQWCANAIWWELKNYVYNALTSKSLKVNDNLISPDYYYIDLSWNSEAFLCYNTDHFCNKIILWYSTWELETTTQGTRESIKTFQEINQNNICHNWKINLWYIWNWTTTYYMLMNKWLTQKKINETKVFYLETNPVNHNTNFAKLTWDIIVVLCYDNECESWKHIGKRHIDGRSQTIEFKKCMFYDNEDPKLCKTWEDEQDDEI